MTAFPLAHACVRKNVPDGPKIQESFLESLPENWAVVSISADLSSDVLLLSRLTRSGSPVVVRLPMARVTDREGESDGLTYSKVMDEFQSILSANDRTAGVAASSAAASYSKADWWAERTRLDEQLEVLLEQIESSWLGGFRGFFTVDPHTSQNEVFEEFREKIGKLIARTVSAKVKVKAPTLDVDLCRMILQLGPDPNPTDIEDLLYYMMDAYQFAGCPVGYDELNIDSMEGSLSDAVRDYHLRAPEGSDQAPEHIVLILDKYVNGIPWESLPCLRHRSVSRLPALAFLETRLLQLQQQQAATADPSSLFYVLNPEKDLVNTESQFKGFLSRSLSRDGWEGIVGAAPTEVQIEKELASKDIYMYFGHGGGEQYVRSHKIRKLEKCAVSLLMGCSSGRLKPAGEYDPSGIALSYMIAGCPALVANLWDVTDRDIDRFSAELFRVWGLGGGAGVGDQRARGRGGSNRGNGGSSSGGGNGGLGSTLCEAVAASRDRCRMKYLVGAAPVVYGVPVRLAARAAAVAS
ncbi:peptidase family C50-domain-containing protein [Zopfochytrium polystomum]|nr:peptidase family C50-domain-containing protein [Zopfochytrium polystomum]